MKFRLFSSILLVLVVSAMSLGTIASAQESPPYPPTPPPSPTVSVEPSVEPTVVVKPTREAPDVVAPESEERGPGSAVLPFTGGDLILFIIIGASAVALGMVVTRLARRRSES